MPSLTLDLGLWTLDRLRCPVMKATRRQFAKVLGVGAAAAALPAHAQQKSATQAPARPAAEPGPQDELRKFPLPMSSEPAFVFQVVEE